MNAPLADITRLYADTSLFCRFEETLGWPGLYRLLDFFEDALRIVVDVDLDLAGLASGQFSGLEMLKKTPLADEFLRQAADPLPPVLAAQVPRIAGRWDDASEGGSRKNHGEVATVLMAAADSASAVLDDGNGQKFASQRGVRYFTTRQVAVQMAARGLVTADEAADVWSKVFKRDSSRVHFDAALAAAGQS